jgi:hypothetical protein
MDSQDELKLEHLLLRLHDLDFLSQKHRLRHQLREVGWVVQYHQGNLEMGLLEVYYLHLLDVNNGFHHHQILHLLYLRLQCLNLHHLRL